jgi:hypothetical protein
MIVFLFQCCKVYQKQSVTVEQAIESKKVKIITIDDRTLYFDSIYYKNDILFGLMNKNKILLEKTEVIIPIESIKSIHLLNKGASVGTNASIGIVILGILLGTVIIIGFIVGLGNLITAD